MDFQFGRHANSRENAFKSLTYLSMSPYSNENSEGVRVSLSSSALSDYSLREGSKVILGYDGPTGTYCLVVHNSGYTLQQTQAQKSKDESPRYLTVVIPLRDQDKVPLPSKRMVYTKKQVRKEGGYIILYKEEAEGE